MLDREWLLARTRSSDLCCTWQGSSGWSAFVPSPMVPPIGREGKQATREASDDDQASR